jgi:hypothetical protein
VTNQLPIPPGYRALIALDRNKHRQLGVAEAKRGPIAAGLHGIQLQSAEFIHAARDYPVVFAKDSATGNFVALAVTGLTAGQNLFVAGDGAWETHRYVPAYIRRWPFFAVQVRVEGATPKTDALICVDESGLDAAAPALFDADGKATDAFRPYETLVREMEGASNQTARLIESLTMHNLLMPFEAHAFPKQGGDLHLTGMFRVDENRLNALEGKVIKGMMKRGELSRIYAHLMSLDNFKFLLDRSAARRAAQA